MGWYRICVRAPYLLYSPNLEILPVWDYVPFYFLITGNMASCGALDVIAMMEMHQSHGHSPLDHHQGTCANKDRRSRKWKLDARDLILLSVIVGRHVDASESFDQDRTGNFCRIIESWPTIIARLWPSIYLHRIGRSTIIARCFYKTVFSLHLCLNS